MSVDDHSDPLINQIKVELVELLKEYQNTAVKDTSALLLPLCQNLESLFRRGLRSHQTTPVGIAKQDYWVWISTLVDNASSSGVSEKQVAAFKSAVDTTQKYAKLKTVQGRGRYFIRLALTRQMITVPIRMLCTRPDIRQKVYDSHMSILGDERLTESVLRVLQEASELDFDLNLKNASFLDETWVLSVYKSYELVPAKELGIKIGYVKGRAMAVSLVPGSVAAEDDKIEVGDVLDELFGVSLYHCKRWRIPSLLKQHRTVPVELDIVKGHFPTGELYPPAASVMRQLGLNVEALQRQYRRKERQKRAQPVPDKPTVDNPESPSSTNKESLPESSNGFRVFYSGAVYLGSDGSKDKITYGIAEMLRRHQPKVPQFTSDKAARGDCYRPPTPPDEEPSSSVSSSTDCRYSNEPTPREVLFTTDEANVTVRDAETKEIMFEHSYTRIGACGRPQVPAVYFAYTIGETSCNLSQHFNCYVYKAAHPDVSRTILQNIVQREVLNERLPCCYYIR